jgi:hypothetical protein
MNNLELNGIVSIFKSIITGLLRTSMTRLRRVIFSKNDEGNSNSNLKIKKIIFSILFSRIQRNNKRSAYQKR